MRTQHPSEGVAEACVKTEVLRVAVVVVAGVVVVAEAGVVTLPDGQHEEREHDHHEHLE